MTPQETFDKGALHLLTQNQTSEDIHGICMYRNSEGLKCAGGVFIPDSKYDTNMENRNWRSLCRLYSEALTWGDAATIMSLQIIHDCEDPVDYIDKLTTLANKQGFSTSIIQQFSKS